jgi:mercuric ion transport protein
MAEKWSSTGSMTAALLSGVAGGLCCIPVSALVALGWERSWIGGLQVFSIFHPVFISAAMMFLGVAFYHTHLAEDRSSMFRGSAVMARRRRQRLAFWVIALIDVAFIALPSVVGGQH